MAVTGWDYPDGKPLRLPGRTVCIGLPPSAELVLDEIEKVQAIQQQAMQTVAEAKRHQEKILNLPSRLGG